MKERHDQERVILITGAPCTGKTTIAKIIAKELRIKHINIGKKVIDENLYLGYDYKRMSFIADNEKLIESLVAEIKRTGYLIIIEGHYADIVPDQFVKKAIVLRTDINELIRRMKGKKYPEKKIEENITAEIMEIPLQNCLESYGKDKIFEIDTTMKSAKEIANLILDLLFRENCL